MENYLVEIWENPNYSKRLYRYFESDTQAKEFCERMAEKTGYDVSSDRKSVSFDRWMTVAFAEAKNRRTDKSLGFNPDPELRSYCLQNEDHYGLVCDTCGCCKYCCVCGKEIV